MTVLSVNVNKVAWLRNARGGDEPDVAWAATTCIEAGAGGITVHPRPDQRHITVADVHRLAGLLAAYPAIEYNLEGNPLEGSRGSYPGFLTLVASVRPQQVTLVPDAIDQVTSNHGWDLAADGAVARLADVVAGLKEQGARVSLFMDAEPDAMAAAAATGADRVELYTEDYARAHAAAAPRPQIERFARAAGAARAAGLGLNAGHDLNLANLTPFLAGVPGIAEVSIGQALISDALRYGLADTVRRYLERIRAAG